MALHDIASLELEEGEIVEDVADSSSSTSTGAKRKIEEVSFEGEENLAAKKVKHVSNVS